MASTPTSTRATSDGFTLVELSLVLLILGVLLSLSVPRLLELGQAHLEGSANRMASMISYLHDEASLRGRIYRLTLDLDRDSYTIEVRAPYARGAQAGELVAAWDPYAEPARLPEGITLASVETASSTKTSGTAELYFLPEDAMAGLSITLARQDGDSLTLAVDGVTGRVRIERADEAR